MKTKPKKEVSPHLEFCEKAHLIRWFHSLEYKQMRALKKAFDAAAAAKEGGTR